MQQQWVKKTERVDRYSHQISNKERTKALKKIFFQANLLIGATEVCVLQ